MRKKRKIFEVLVFNARAASGKSECLTAINKMSADLREKFLHIGKEVVVLDDFIYVDFMRAVDEGLEKIGAAPIFFPSPNRPFSHPEISWKLLILFLNEDYKQVKSRRQVRVRNATEEMMRRFDRAAKQLGALPFFFSSGNKTIYCRPTHRSLCDFLEKKARHLIEYRNLQIPKNIKDTTILIEFARGGEYNASMPLPYAYADSYSVIDPEILEQAAFLYLKVLPEQAIMKNFERFDPKDPSGILGHCVPLEVMYKNYGSDDFEYLLQKSGVDGLIEVVTCDGEPQYVPAAILDNVKDLTTFVRKCKNVPWEKWPARKRQALLVALKTTCEKLWALYPK